MLFDFLTDFLAASSLRTREHHSHGKTFSQSVPFVVEVSSPRVSDGTRSSFRHVVFALLFNFSQKAILETKKTKLDGW